MTANVSPPHFDSVALQRLAEGRHHDPHNILGSHERSGKRTFLAYLPATREARIEGGPALQRLPGSDFFWCAAPAGGLERHPALLRLRDDGIEERRIDPYGFLPSVEQADLALFGSGGHAEAWKLLGAHPAHLDGVEGVRFAVWAPNAERVSVVGPFCEWDGRRLPMRSMGGSGVWELFVPGLATGEVYKFEIRNRDTGGVELKTDPYARAMELRPSTASLVCGGS
ncbi:MAG: hypothetical protein RLZZ200_2896, partial [Pseudomonadota bacterium]